MRVVTSYSLFMIVACCHGDGSQLYLEHHASGMFLENDLYVNIMSHIPHPHISSTNIHVPATCTPNKKIRRRMPTINTSPMMVPTAIPTKTPGNGRDGKSVTVPPGEKLGRTLGGKAVAGEIKVYQSTMSTCMEAVLLEMNKHEYVDFLMQ